jgi:hypothetical protein
LIVFMQVGYIQQGASVVVWPALLE